MKTFNSLGSNYTFPFVLKSLFTIGRDQERVRLKTLLEKRYEGHAELFYKGREALTFALRILSLPESSKVAINGFTCVAVFNAIRIADLEPICLDLEKNSNLNFSAATLEKAVKKDKTIRVVIIQNTLGYPCEIEKIKKICDTYNLVLIEDLAHCVGTTYKNGKEAGTVGDFTALSFSQDKIIDAITGGALIIRNKKYQNYLKNFVFLNPKNAVKDRLYPAFTYKIRTLYTIGLGKPYHYLLKKLNLLSNIMDESFYALYSLPHLNAALTIAQFHNLDTQLAHRRSIAKLYKERLNKSIMRTPILEEIPRSSNLRFPIFVEKRKELIKMLQKEGIFVGDIWYSDVAPECAIAVEESTRILNLPTHIHVSQKKAMKIINLINKTLS